MIFSEVEVAEWPSVLKQLLTQLTVCSLCSISICNSSRFQFWSEGMTLVLIAPVPGHCLTFTLRVEVHMFTLN